MFTTHESARVGHPELFAEGRNAWAIIEQDLHLPWFHVSITSSINGEKSSFIRLLGSESVLEQLLSQLGEEMQVTDIQVVTPASVNGQDRWMMERLIKLEVGQNSRRSITHIISVESGAVYNTRHDARCEAAELRDVRVIYCRNSRASTGC